MLPSLVDIRKAYLNPKDWFEGTLLTLDPGQTTGFAFWESTPTSINLINTGQVCTWGMPSAVANLASLFDAPRANLIVYEVYNIYSWKTDSHAWSAVPTLRVIGCIETLAIQRSIPIHTQTAQVAKSFATDEKLKGWNLYPTGIVHARDAIRHGVHFLTVGRIQNTS